MASTGPGTAGTEHHFLVPQVLTNIALYRLKDRLFMPMLANHTFNEYFQGKAVGDTIWVKREYYSRAYEGSHVSQYNALIDRSVPIKVDKWVHSAIRINSKDVALNISEADFVRRFVDPQFEAIIRKYNIDGLENLFANRHYMEGTPGTAISRSTAQDMLAHAVDMSIPENNRSYAIFHTREAVKLSVEMQDLKAGDDLINQSIRTNFKGYIANHMLFSSSLIPQQKVAGIPTGATVQVRGANQRGDSIATDGWGVNNTTVLYKGQIVTFNGVNEIMVTHRDSNFDRVETGRLAQFTVTEDVTTNASGQATIKISPEIVGADSGQTINNPSGVNIAGTDQTTIDSSIFQNVSNIPADNAVVNVFGRNTSANAERKAWQGMFFNGDCLEYVSVPLPDLESTPESAQGHAMDPETGLNLSFLKSTDFGSRSERGRMDALYGVETIRPDMTVGHWGGWV